MVRTNIDIKGSLLGFQVSQAMCVDRGGSVVIAMIEFGTHKLRQL
jgi:hypothetical protein